MSLPYSRAPHSSGTPVNQPEAPNAALLIDFDNVTMGMRSDLSKELKNLLNSDIIKGKVTVQRAYADWRRYPQYIVPLSENSVDLIFAPAYGSSKKNATDIRMAIDGMELVFIRPEIGTFILLTGDSDFSSLVLKLKEYGKYVIGVGIQESSSDILVQNCDEYYSYTSLSGLKKTTDSANKPLDPWVLVEEAVKKMASRNDVMRSDRLKQVMIEIDASFDEGNFGFSKFSKFLSEASSRNLVALRKLENGQYEVQPPGSQAAEDGKSRGGSTRRAEVRNRGREEKAAGGGPAGQGKKPEESGGREKTERGSREPDRSEADKGKGTEDPLRAGYDLLRQALGRLMEGGDGGPVRDSDLKRKMLELQPTFDEGELGFGKFSRFLRQAHDHEVIDLEKREEGTYQVSLPGERPDGPGKMSVEEGEEPAALPPIQEKPAAGRGSKSGGWGLGLRRGERGRPKEKEGPPPILEGQVVQPGKAAASPEEDRSAGGAGAAHAAPSSEISSDTVLEPGKLGLPTGRAAVIRYLTNSYKGVGKKTAETLVDTFGGDLFKVLQRDPDRITSVVTGKRAEQLLDAWRADHQRRLERATRSGDKPGEHTTQAEIAFSGEEPDQEEGPSGGGESPPGNGEADETAQTGENGGQEDKASGAKSPPKRRTRRGGRSRRQ